MSLTKRWIVAIIAGLSVSLILIGIGDLLNVPDYLVGVAVGVFVYSTIESIVSSKSE